MVQDVQDNHWLLPRYPSNEDTSTYRAQLQDVASRKQWVCISENWDEIAEFVGCDAETLKASVAEYNASCEHGYDETFVKDRRYLKPLKKGPFYAVKFGVMVVETAGPVRVNEKMEVLNKDYKAIPGLYAAGVIASGWLGHDYCGDYVFGSALGFSVNSGRIAGECAAQHALAVK
jgi:fumarate reductase flavoprotein subunit